MTLFWPSECSLREPELTAFAAALTQDAEDWRLEELPPNGEQIGGFTLLQEKAIKFGETQTDGKLYEFCQLTLYEDSRISLEIARITAFFEIPEKTAAYLKEYF